MTERSIGLPGRNVKLQPPSTRTASPCSTAGSTPRKRGPAIELDTAVSRHLAAKPQQIYPSSSTVNQLPKTGAAPTRKHKPPPLNLENNLSPSDRFIPIGFVSKPHLNERATEDRRQNRFTRSRRSHKQLPKTPTIVVTPSDPSKHDTTEQTPPSPRKAASSYYSRALSQILSPRTNPKTVSDASFHCRGIDQYSPRSTQSLRPRLSSIATDQTPHSSASSFSRYYRASTDTARRSEGWWDYIRTPFTGRQTAFSTAAKYSTDTEKQVVEASFLANVAPMGRSKSLTPRQTKCISPELTPLIQEGRERRILMYGQAAAYYDPTCDLSTPPPADPNHITHGELRDLARTAMSDHAQDNCGIDMDEATRELPHRGNSRGIKLDEGHAEDSQGVKGQPTGMEAYQSPSPTSTVFSSGVASVARVHSARHVQMPPSDRGISGELEQEHIATMDHYPLQHDTRTPQIYQPSPRLASAFTLKHDDRARRASEHTVATNYMSNSGDPHETRAATYYDLTGVQATPRANAVMIRHSSPPPPLPEEMLNPFESSQNQYHETGAVMPLRAPSDASTTYADDEKFSMGKKDSFWKRQLNYLRQDIQPSAPCAWRPNNKKQLVIWGSIAAGSMLFMLLIILVCLFVVQHHVDMPVQASWLNLTGYPPLPTGVMTIAGTSNTAQVGGCVSPADAWSCALPKGTGAVNKGLANVQPNFRLEIRFKNGTVEGNLTHPLRRRQSGRTLRARDVFNGIVFNTYPDPPSTSDQEFLGNTTDGVHSSQPIGEASPFFITLLGANQSATVPTQVNSSISSNQTAFRMASNRTSNEVKLPGPIENENGTASHGALHPFPTSQPLRLYNRGSDDEHFGFYTYFDRALLVAFPSAVPDVQVSSANSSADTVPSANAQCIWTQTRFLVQIWTRRPTVGALPSASSSSLNGTSSAYAYQGAGSFPYATTVTLDRHGGDPAHKGVICYGVGNDGTIDFDEQILLDEDRGFGGHLVGGGVGPFEDAPRGTEAVDGGSGGCRCAWSNV